jgi:hypothetical protein
LNYLVKIDGEGKLRWDKSNEFVDTTAGHWKDAGDGSGIVPQDNPEVESENGPPRSGSFDSVSAELSVTSEQENAATHYAGGAEGKTKLERLRRHLTLHGLMDRLLRKTVQRNTWIFVSDKHCLWFSSSNAYNLILKIAYLANLFVGIKGMFIRSSGLHNLTPRSDGEIPAFIIPLRWSGYVCWSDICQTRGDTHIVTVVR